VALAVFGIAAVAHGLTRAWRRAGGGEERAAVLAATGALVAAGLHAGTDFGLTLPANAWTLSVVVGAALAVGTRPEGRPERPESGADQPPEATADQPAEEPSSKPSTNSG
jgi:hypothetical protein